jgi:hypothetical protein
MCLLTDLRVSNITRNPLTFNEPEVFQSRKMPVIFVMFVRLYACISAAPTGRISVKFRIRDFCENMFREFKYGEISGSLHEYLSTFF